MLERLYGDIIRENGFEHDQSQAELVRVLDNCKQQIDQRVCDRSLLKRILNSGRAKLDLSGIYIHGEVGGGKSMLIDLFFGSLETNNKYKSHFHNFMLEFHEALHQLRLEMAKANSKNSDPVLQLARQLADKYEVICLDELQINNIADAMLVGRLFQCLVDNGTFVVMSSNRPPHELFKDGLQRERFIPFIELVEQRMLVYHLNSNRDYRVEKVAGLDKVYIHPLGQKTSAALDEIVVNLIGDNTWEEREIFINKDRKLLVHRAHMQVARFSFNELCQVPLGAIDYLALAANFSTIIIENIPQMNSDMHNEALRFITLIDCLYESKTKLICTAQVAHTELYQGGRNQFEFARTISRLAEMQSLDYIVLTIKKSVSSYN
jgi:cell division protein ZapE